MYSNNMPEVAVGLGTAMGHLTGVLNESNLFSRRGKRISEQSLLGVYRPGFPGDDTSRKSTESRGISDNRYRDEKW